MKPNSEYHHLIELCKDSRNSLNALYKLNTDNEIEISNIYKNLKEQIDSPKKLIDQIILSSKYNLRFFKSYWTIYKKVLEEFQPKYVRKYKNPFAKFSDSISTLSIHENYPIYDAIKENNLLQFAAFTNTDDFDETEKLKSDFYPMKNHEYGLLELCCYYGSVDCFKFMISTFESSITPECLQLSFIGGNLEIINECIKTQKPDKKCMKYAIISHNIDFVSFLMNEHNISIDINYCCKYCFIEAFCAYLVHTKDFHTSFINSPKFFFSAVS